MPRYAKLCYITKVDITVAARTSDRRTKTGRARARARDYRKRARARARGQSMGCVPADCIL